MQTLEQKFTQLKNILRSYEGALVAYSGGVDSAFLAKVAHAVLGDKLLAVTACSETYPDREIKAALQLAESIGLPHLIISTEELTSEQFASNPPDRCYFCKNELFGKLLDIARERGLNYVLDGANFDDQFDHRPGMKAGKELGVKSPIKEAGLTKQEVRELSKRLGLPTWNKPSFACLSSRFPYGERITQEKLTMVGQAEEYINSLGIAQFRVRHHGNLARIEVDPADFPKILTKAAEIIDNLKQLGYVYVTLDLSGYRTGSMNETLKN